VRDADSRRGKKVRPLHVECLGFSSAFCISSHLTYDMTT